LPRARFAVLFDNVDVAGHQDSLLGFTFSCEGRGRMGAPASESSTSSNCAKAFSMTVLARLHSDVLGGRQVGASSVSIVVLPATGPSPATRIDSQRTGRAPAWWEDAAAPGACPARRPGGRRAARQGPDALGTGAAGAEPRRRSLSRTVEERLTSTAPPGQRLLVQAGDECGCGSQEGGQGWPPDLEPQLEVDLHACATLSYASIGAHLSGLRSTAP
jgi:hypothetical protein